MRFLIILISFGLSSSISMAAVSDFNGLVRETSSQEKRLHRKLLQSIQQTQTAIAYNDKWDRMQSQEAAQKDVLRVRLVREQ